MIIAFGCDHAAAQIRKDLTAFIESLGHQVTDHGCDSADSCDYPDYAYKVAESVSGMKADLGILVCGTGVGMSMAANKVPGVRAAVCYSNEVAKLVKEHNDSNILCLSARFAGLKDLKEWIKTWIETPFSNQERHARRVEKISQIEKKFCKRMI